MSDPMAWHAELTDSAGLRRRYLTCCGSSSARIIATHQNAPMTNGIAIINRTLEPNAIARPTSKAYLQFGQASAAAGTNSANPIANNAVANLNRFRMLINSKAEASGNIPAPTRQRKAKSEKPISPSRGAFQIDRYSCTSKSSE